MVAWALARALATSTLRQELAEELQRVDALLKDAADGLESQAEDHEDLRQAAALAAVTVPDLGVAVSSAGGQLNTAVLRQASSLPLGEFIAAYGQAVALARRGEHQSLARVAWIVSSLGPSGPDGAVAVVPPAFGTLFVSMRAGELSLWLSFDHRWITGGRALQLLDGVAASLVELRQSLEGAPP
jgi:pyruvate/2-oxoglutarate dehydrogenase complex dihydrolipoamide acyltransferase (E2) component